MKPAQVQKFLWLLLLAAMGLWLSGCGTVEGDAAANTSTRPWASPKGWEGGAPMGMYDHYRR